MKTDKTEQRLLSYFKSFAISEEYEITENFASEMISAGFTDATPEGVLSVYLRKACENGTPGIKASESPYISG